MRVRPFEANDGPILHAIYESTDYHQLPFPDLEKSLSARVIIDDSDAPVMAAYMRLIPEGTLICGAGGPLHPTVKMQAISLLHESLRDDLVSMGYYEAIASVPPQLQGYRRHLQRHLNWKESWPTYRILDWRRA